MLDMAEGTIGYAVEQDNQTESLKGNGTLSGWAVSEKGTPDLSVDVALGSGIVNGVYASTGSTTNVTLAAVDPTNPRIDIITMDSSGTAEDVTGTPAASPVPADLPDNKILLARVLVEANETTILNADITEQRIIIVSGRMQVEISANDATEYSTTGTAWVTKKTMTFTPNEARHLCLGFKLLAEMKMSSGTGAPHVRLEITLPVTNQSTSNRTIYSVIAVGPTSETYDDVWLGCGCFSVDENATNVDDSYGLAVSGSSSYTVKVQIQHSDAGETAYIKNIKVEAYIFENSQVNSSSSMWS